jgi:hypothetical protein
MEQSILTSTKKALHIGPDDDSFDLDVMIHINSAFSTLHDLGVGPEEGFSIEDATSEWDNFLPIDEDKVQHAQVKTFVILSSRLAFDPPSSAYLLTASQAQLAELTSRISMRRENAKWAPPAEELLDVIDAGDAG